MNVPSNVSALATEGSMRRFLIVPMVVVLLVSLSVLAEAGSPKVRFDPNDSHLNTDVRRVVSDLSNRTLYVRIDAWQKLRPYFVDGGWRVLLDTSGNRHLDRAIDIFAPRGRFTCVVHKYHARTGLLGAVVGNRRASRPTWRSVGCSLPRSWFPRIQRAVRFFVISGPDRAPDRGFYVWL